MKRVLFLVRKRHGYNYSTDPSTGLYNSASFVVQMLNSQTPHMAALEIAHDGNAIDALLVKYRPHVAIIEAVWVTPDKLSELRRLHPNVHFVVRLHSNIPFLAQEGMALTWLQQYSGIVEVSANSRQMAQDLSSFLPYPVTYTPNYYAVKKLKKVKARMNTLNIGCFGAIRPFKNHLSQALAALQFAHQAGRPLRFHINIARVEGGYVAENILKNLRAVFAASAETELVEHGWLSHEDFLRLVREMDVSMQVSFTETFNIVSADAVTMGVPIVVSKAVEWALPLWADPTNVSDIEAKLRLAYELGKTGVVLNAWYLQQHNKQAVKAWISELA